MTPTEQLQAARRGDEVWPALYRGAYRKRHRREPADPGALTDAPPTAFAWPETVRAALAAWLLDRAGPDRALLRAIEFGDGSGRALLGAVADEDGDRPAEQPPSGWPVSMAAGLAASIRRTTLCLVTPYGLLPSGAAIDYAEAQGWHYLNAASLDLLAGAVQLLWLEAGGPHPLAPLAHAWLRWQDTMPTERPPFAPATRGSLPRLGKLGTDDATLPDFPASGRTGAGRATVAARIQRCRARLHKLAAVAFRPCRRQEHGGWPWCAVGPAPVRLRAVAPGRGRP